MEQLRTLASLELIEPEEASKSQIRGKGILDGYMYKEGKKNLMNKVTIDKRYFVFDTNKMSITYYKDEKNSFKESEARGFYDLERTKIASFVSPSAEPKLLELNNSKSMDIHFVVTNHKDKDEKEKLVFGAIKGDAVSERLFDIIKSRVEKNNKKSTEIVRPTGEGSKEQIDDMFSDVLEALAIPQGKREGDNISFVIYVFILFKINK